MLDHFGRRHRTELAGVFIAGVAHEAGQEARREQIACTGRIAQLLDLVCGHCNDAFARNHDTALLAAGDDAELGILAELRERRIEIMVS